MGRRLGSARPALSPDSGGLLIVHSVIGGIGQREESLARGLARDQQRGCLGRAPVFISFQFVVAERAGVGGIAELPLLSSQESAGGGK
ncbi:hypothetical protein [Sphingopyxis sp.]|uniref:hypothetical protein n=1 Tax=Sphingopyxis sp. TaxID=1908224 RepID=UPI001DDA594C|nr:hypothetical protein [Sphingopyxis sp.]MBW8296011.1 hypothetical protein [Sphingopyxis sp.]